MNITRVKITCDDGTLFDSGELDEPTEYLWRGDGAEPRLELAFTGGGILLGLYHNNNGVYGISRGGYIHNVDMSDVLLTRKPNGGEISTFVMAAAKEGVASPAMMLLRGHPLIQQMVSEALE